MHFVFLSHLVPPASDPDFENAGLGGSDAALVLLARALAQAGHRVDVYTSGERGGMFHGVSYAHLSHLDLARPCDMLVVVNGDASEWTWIKARRRWFWATEFIGPDWGAKVAPFVDQIVCLSPYHLQRVLRDAPAIDPAKFRVLDLGVAEQDYFDLPPEELPAKPGRRMIYCSMPDRGLEHLARLFPRVREQVPEAELTITADFSLWGQPPGNEQCRALFYGMAGVHFFGKVPRYLLVELQRSARVLAYPCFGGERFSISAAECLAAGAVPVTTNDFALKTTVAEAGILLDGRPGEAAYDAAFVANTVRLLSDDQAHRTLAVAGRQAAFRRFRWSCIAEQFVELARGPESELQSAGVQAPPAAAEASQAPTSGSGPMLIELRVPDLATPLPEAYPSICVAIPLYNMAGYLRRAVMSVLWQLEPRDELIVVDDASTDLTGYGGLEPYLDRIRWVRNPVNRGLPYSRNRALEHANADWMKFLDADDLLAPFALNLIRRADPPIPPHIHVVAGGCHRIVNHVYADYLTSSRESLGAIKEMNPLLTSAVFIRRAALLAVGTYDERLDFEEDWDMWLRLHERFGLDCFAAVPAPVCYYWIHQVDRQGKRRHATVEGMTGREYFRRRYGCQPVG